MSKMFSNLCVKWYHYCPILTKIHFDYYESGWKLYRESWHTLINDISFFWAEWHLVRWYTREVKQVSLLFGFGIKQIVL